MQTTMHTLRIVTPLVIAASLVGGGDSAAADLLYTCSHDGSACEARVPDGTGSIASTISVPAGACSSTVAVGVDLLHTHVGDLTLTLQVPGGASYTVLQRPAEAGDAPGSCAGDDVRGSFRDGGSAANPCAQTIPAVGGQVAPVTSLAALTGPVAAGTWTLQVSDASVGGEGLLRGWELSFPGCPGGLFVDGFED